MHDLKIKTEQELLETLLRLLDKELQRLNTHTINMDVDYLPYLLQETVRRGLVKGISPLGEQSEPSPPGNVAVMLPPGNGFYGSGDVLCRTPRNMRVTLLELLGAEIIDRPGRIAALLAWENENNPVKSTNVLEMAGFSAFAIQRSPIHEGYVMLSKIEATLPSTIEQPGVAWIRNEGTEEL